MLELLWVRAMNIKNCDNDEHSHEHPTLDKMRSHRNCYLLPLLIYEETESFNRKRNGPVCRLQTRTPAIRGCRTFGSIVIQPVAATTSFRIVNIAQEWGKGSPIRVLSCCKKAFAVQGACLPERRRSVLKICVLQPV